LAAAAFLVLGGGSAPAAPAGEAVPVSPEDICAVAARPELPGYDQAESPARSAGVDASALVDGTNWRFVYWGDCPVRPAAIESMSFSPDGRFALTEGGWQAGPLAGGWGYCLFEKTDKGWLPAGCVLTAIS
jgi:hypothetical protein